MTMPLYEFFCDKCQKEVSVTMTISERGKGRATCPHCGSHELRPLMVGVVREAAQQGRVVAAICHAGWMLVSAGILKGRKGTSFFSIKDDLVAAGANWVDAEVVVDGNLIPSRRPDDLPAFCRAIISALSKS